MIIKYLFLKLPLFEINLHPESEKQYEIYRHNMKEGKKERKKERKSAGALHGRGSPVLCGPC